MDPTLPSPLSCYGALTTEVLPTLREQAAGRRAVEWNGFPSSLWGSSLRHPTRSPQKANGRAATAGAMQAASKKEHMRRSVERSSGGKWSERADGGLITDMARSLVKQPPPAPALGQTGALPTAKEVLRTSKTLVAVGSPAGVFDSDASPTARHVGSMSGGKLRKSERKKALDSRDMQRSRTPEAMKSMRKSQELQVAMPYKACREFL